MGLIISIKKRICHGTNLRIEKTLTDHWLTQNPQGKQHPWVAVISAKNHKRQRRKRQSVTAEREESQTPKVLTAILTLPNLT